VVFGGKLFVRLYIAVGGSGTGTVVNDEIIAPDNVDGHDNGNQKEPGKTLLGEISMRIECHHADFQL
jgi:hypothetical protein